MKMNAESGLESSVKSYMLRKGEVCTVVDLVSKDSVLNEHSYFFRDPDG